MRLIDVDSDSRQRSRLAFPVDWNSVPFNKPRPPILQLVCPNDDHNAVHLIDLSPVTHHRYGYTPSPPCIVCEPIRSQPQFCEAPSNEFETSGKDVGIWMPSLPPYSRYHHTTRTRIHGPRIDECYPRHDGREEESQSLGYHYSSCHALELNRIIFLVC